MRLRQVLFNLVGNALKFTTSRPDWPGQVKLDVSAITRFDGSPGVQLRVSDNGPGMSAEVIDKLFTPFTQADASTMRQFGGTGLGLSISQRLIDLMGGHISVRSAPGEGAEFTVVLPLQEVTAESLHKAANSATKALPQTAAATHHRPGEHLILVAEDNETNRDVLLEQLQLLGYTAHAAADGAAALVLWRHGHYDLLLTDCHMPYMDGFELTAGIRQSEPVGTHLPIIAITANAMQGEAQRCRARGMDDYLCKPLRLRELGDMLARWLPGTQASTPPSDASVLIADTEDSIRASSIFAIWDPDALGALVGDNPATQQRLLTRFLVNAQAQREAILGAVAQGDLATLTTQAHTLKSAARSVGAMALGELCQTLETAGRQQDGPACSTLAEQLPTTLDAAQACIEQQLSDQGLARAP
jgi:CheY-like chemotaxis protein/HPt (histidine-containing phosphotransfer) domain-containing protein